MGLLKGILGVENSSYAPQYNKASNLEYSYYRHVQSLSSRPALPLKHQEALDLWNSATWHLCLITFL